MEKLQNKMLVRFFIVIIIPMVIISTVTITVTSRQLRMCLRKRLADSVKGIEIETGTLQKKLLSVAVSMSLEEEIRQAFKEEDRQGLLSILAPLRNLINVDILTAIDEHGIVLARAHNPARYGDDVCGMDIFNRAREGKKIIDFVQDVGGIGIVAAVAVGLEGETVGVLKIGKLFDYNSLNLMKKKYGLDSVVYDGKRLQATTFSDPVIINAADLIAARDEILSNKKPLGRTAILAGRGYVLAAEPIVSNDKRLLGVYLVSICREQTQRAVVLLAVLFGSITLALLVITFLACYGISLGIVKPIKRLIEITRSVAGGDFGVKVQIPSNDEIGQLASAFNKMTQDLQETTTSIKNLEAEITRRKKVEKQRQRLLKVLASQNEELESIIYVTSHDMRSPLINVQGFAGELSESCRKLEDSISGIQLPGATGKQIQAILDDDIPTSIKYITGGARTLDALQKGLLRLCRLGREPLSIEHIDMNRLLADVVDSMKRRIDKSQATVSLGKVGDCFGDKGLIYQVFAGLLDNAIKYFDPKRPGRIEISATIEERLVVYCVSDNGIGIDASQHDKIFDVFYRLSPEESPEGEGIGLAVVRRIVDKHDGRVRVESQPGKGSSFFISLPGSKELLSHEILLSEG